MKSTKITVEATISEGVQKIWDYYTQPAHITNWNFASDDWCCPRAENDLRVGGKLKSRMEARDGSMGFDFEAIYDVVKDQHKISYTMADGRKCTIEFESQDGETKVTTTFDAENQNSLDMQRDGWQAILDNFKSYVEAN